jgi:hypothetical protein
LRDRQIDELIASQDIGPHEHPIRIPVSDSTLQVRLHRALIAEGIQTYEKVSRQTEVNLRRYIIAIGPRSLIQLYTEMNAFLVPLPRDATPISRLRLAVNDSRLLPKIYGDGEPDHPPDHPNTPGCTCGYCHDEPDTPDNPDTGGPA